MPQSAEFENMPVIFPDGDQVVIKTYQAYVAVVHDSVPLKKFFEKAGVNCKCLDRFVDRQLVYFTADHVYPERRDALKIRVRPDFKVEHRESPVLMLTLRGRSHIALDEALEIVRLSKLQHLLPQIRAVAVAAPGRKRVSCHAYVEFTTNELARRCTNIVDALPFKGTFVHSPQLAHNGISPALSEAKGTVWRNPNVGDAADVPRPLSSGASSQGSDTQSDSESSQRERVRGCASDRTLGTPARCHVQQQQLPRLVPQAHQPQLQKQQMQQQQQQQQQQLLALSQQMQRMVLLPHGQAAPLPQAQGQSFPLVFFQGHPILPLGVAPQPGAFAGQLCPASDAEGFGQ